VVTLKRDCGAAVNGDKLRRWTLTAFVVASALLIAFCIALLVIGYAAVDDPGKTERLADGRVVSVGKSWPGAFDSCVVDIERRVLPNCYREKVSRGAVVKQWVSSITALAMSFVGLAILLMVGLERSAGSGPSIFRTPYVEWLGFVALAMGPGSIVFHATLTKWGGWLDQMSMYLLLSFMASYDLMRVLRRGFWTFLALYVGILVVAAIAASFIGLVAFIATGVGTGLFVAVVLYFLLRRVGLLRDRWRFWLAVGLFAASLVPWLASNPARGDPTGIPFHGAWHVLAAVFIGAYFLYLRSERVAVAPS
jgi:hypothetical protein